MLSVMCSQERPRVCGGEQARLLPARCRPSGPTHKGEGHVKRQGEKKRKKKKDRRQEQVSKLGEGSFFFGLVSPSPSPAFAFAVENLSCHTAPISWLSFLSLFFYPSLLNQWIPAKHSHCIIRFQK